MNNKQKEKINQINQEIQLSKTNSTPNILSSTIPQFKLKNSRDSILKLSKFNGFFNKKFNLRFIYLFLVFNLIFFYFF